MSVFDQYRKVAAGNFETEDLDMSITVEHSKSDKHTFNVTIWNLKLSTWSGVKVGDQARITLGWTNGPQQAVMTGKVEKKNMKKDGMDTKFILKGVANAKHALKQRFSQTFQTTKTPTDVVGTVASKIGLTGGSINSVNQTFSQKFQISSDKPARHWLDVLKEEAENRTNVSWEWFTDGGRLYFVKKNGRTEDAITLSYDNTLTSIAPAGSEAKDAKGLEFEALMEPGVRKGGVVAVDTENYSGAYKVTNYKFKSDSTNGTHKVSGRLEPLGVEYTIE